MTFAYFLWVHLAMNTPCYEYYYSSNLSLSLSLSLQLLNYAELFLCYRKGWGSISESSLLLQEDSVERNSTKLQRSN